LVREILLDEITIASLLDSEGVEGSGPSKQETKLPSVLIVEDEALVAKDISRTLTELGYRVTGCVPSASAALLSLEDVRPDLVLSDIRLKGGLDGIQLSATIQERFGLPVVFLSSHADPATVARAAATNPYGYVLKPFRVRELHAGLELALRRHAIDDRLQQQSMTDELTGLYNRRGFQLLAEHQIKLALRSGRSAAILLADLNGMKAVNDTYGHEAGDQLLLDATRVLRGSFRGSDIVCRLGGDEFVALAVDATPAALELLRHRIQAKVDEVNAEEGRRCRLSMSIGIGAWNSAVHRTLADVLADADAKMYEAKAAARKRGSGPMPALRKSHCAPTVEGAVGSSSGHGGVADAFIRMVDMRDRATGSHARLVARYSRVIAQTLGFAIEATRALGRAALLHDVGELVSSAARVGADETGENDSMELITFHTTRGAEILRGTQDELLERAAVIALGHHEHWDGTGYPGHLRGEECPLDARIVAAADAYDQLVRLGSNDETIRRRFTRAAGTEFEPTLAAVVLESLPILRSMGDATRPTRPPPARPLG
jgi:diguanylate cyclase (GGDEF)-like protein